MRLRTIEIDFDIHKLIELERKSFDESEYVVLRRLLKLPDLSDIMSGKEASASEGRPFIQESVVVPHGSLAKMEYGRGSQLYDGKFLDGFLVVNGERYTTLSAAAGDLAVTKDGKKTSLNGWNYWSAKFPGETKWKRLLDLRREAAK